MTTLIVTVFVASFVNSLHCAGMCGAFVALAVGLEGDKPISRARLHAAYNGGRLLAYTGLGVLAGAIGDAANMGGSMMGMPRIAAMCAAGVMIFMGLIMLVRLAGVSVPRFRTPKPLQAVAVAGHRGAMRFNPTWRALIIGLMTAFLPCGLLYMFAVLAMGKASPLLGGVIMAAFWLGTLPIMLSIGVAVRAIAGRFGPAVQAAMAVLIVCAGVWTAFRRVDVDLSKHDHEMTSVSLSELTERAAKIDAADAACCDPEGGDE